MSHKHLVIYTLDARRNTTEFFKQSVRDWYPTVSTKFRGNLGTAYKEDTFQLIELLNADGQMEITKLIDALLEIFFVRTQKEIQNAIKYLILILQRQSS